MVVVRLFLIILLSRYTSYTLDPSILCHAHTQELIFLYLRQICKQDKVFPFLASTASSAKIRIMSTCEMQGQQNKCPHIEITGSSAEERQILHSNGVEVSSFSEDFCSLLAEVCPSMFKACN